MGMVEGLGLMVRFRVEEAVFEAAEHTTQAVGGGVESIEVRLVQKVLAFGNTSRGPR